MQIDLIRYMGEKAKGKKIRGSLLRQLLSQVVLIRELLLH